MKRDTIATGEALPDFGAAAGVDVTDRAGVASTETLIRSVGSFVTACNAVPFEGPATIGVLSRRTLAKVYLRRALDAFCDARGIERL